MIYLLLWKEVVVLYGLPLFPSMYHLYWLELVFRGWSVHVGRRSYCAYKGSQGLSQCSWQKE